MKSRLVPVITDHLCSTRESNVFRHVCPSIHRGRDGSSFLPGPSTSPSSMILLWGGKGRVTLSRQGVGSSCGGAGGGGRGEGVRWFMVSPTCEQTPAKTLLSLVLRTWSAKINTTNMSEHVYIFFKDNNVCCKLAFVPHAKTFKMRLLYVDQSVKFTARE